eukprot:CAMPEP_0203678050 /NCGR_PEP_ID=MMETSP0090-20130426/30502_1 /ASSEMBLY_ACC=CAM_ASM_001088 /TAXON_ID=426623 /ORGANISM="Chaetoceros affinis, Strain CCMP159" /LENGTH=324 /DNA_ID=CAMNT_0050545133 /DNA_START=92 /DNA_END=1066 /DNA_ORIENTATION=-
MSTDRHCASCLKSVPATQAKVCSKCKLRCYCSQTCQRKDWKGGHQHRHWCGTTCGEEDVDWEIRPVEGKGMGVVALREFQAKERIMVEAPCGMDHDGIQTLMPHHGSIEDKVALNSLGCGHNLTTNGHTICLRMARCNHDCNPNASHFYDHATGMKILFAERVINAGEEISIAYAKVWNPDNPLSPQQTRSLLQIKWNITCPDDCCCRDEAWCRGRRELMDMDRDVLQLGSMGECRKAFYKAKRMLQAYETTPGFSWLDKERAMYDCFQMGIAQRSTLKAAIPFIHKVYNLAVELFTADSASALKYRRLLEDPKSHRNYLLIGA